MTRKITLLLLIIISLSLSFSCQSSSEIEVFDYDVFSDVSLTFAKTESEFLYVSGNNIAIADYDYQENTLVINKEYLAYLSPNIYNFKVYFVDEIIEFEIEVVDRNQKYRVMNGDFETGNLFGWSSETIFKGENSLQVFTDADVVSTTDLLGRNINGNSYVLGFNQEFVSKALHEEKMGYLKSNSFTLGGTGLISFSLAGGGNPNICYISVKKVSDNQEIARLGNSRFDIEQITFLEDLYFFELNNYYLDLSDYLGESLYIEIHDLGGLANDFLIIDNIITFHETEVETGYQAINILAEITQNYLPNQLINGDFSFGLDYYFISNPYESIPNTFWVDGNVLKSNLEGDDGIGLIKSSLFRLNGSGVISMELAAAQGERYDKNTYISIRLFSTNEEIYRFANDRHNGIEFIKYYLDLSDYLDEVMYIEIVDNGLGSYSTIFVRDIITYYPDEPDYDYSLVARNLNY